VNQRTGVVVGRDELANWLIRDTGGAIWCARSLTEYQSNLLAAALHTPRTVVSSSRASSASHSLTVAG
jgi:hypothetical protein